MGAPRANRLAGSLAIAAMATAIFALLPGGGGCELVVSDALPSFTCVPGAADSCPTGSVCVPSTHQCISQTGTCVPGAAGGCAAGLRCDPQTLRCAKEATGADAADGEDAPLAMTPDSGPDSPNAVSTDAPTEAAPGTPDATPLDATPDVQNTCRGITCGCSGNGSCDSGVCVGPVTLPSALYSAIGYSLCSQPCCTSADCPGATVCFGTGGGGNYCLEPHWIGRSAVLGAGQGGATCAADSDCRSGLCAMSGGTGACADTCCSTAQEASECASGTVCRFAAFPGHDLDTHETAWCGAAIGSMSGGTICGVDTTCQSGKCAARCEAVCRNTADCGGGGLACSYGLGPTLPSNKDIVLGCVIVTGTTANGGMCTGNSDCQSAFCDNSMHCTDACVTDADCKSGLHCKPVVVQVQGNYSVLACES
ncbi:MAG TPA: hypothetical protein VK762_08525 [Polyangiaceae bacterium]|jgi:hypothetical protein|nr:hypothetical protein [Polyangiaceae bacterium]